MKVNAQKSRTTFTKIPLSKLNESKGERVIKKGASPSPQQARKKNVSKAATKERESSFQVKEKAKKPLSSKGKLSTSNKPRTKEEKEKEDALLKELQKANNDFIKVFVRFRPLNDLENGLLSDNYGWTTPKFINESTIGIYSTKEIKDKDAQIPGNLIFKYDKVFKLDSPQNEIYEYVGKRIVDDVMEGYNGTIFAYGQSGSGKTYTMYGPDIFDDLYKGIIPRIVEDIFNYVEKADDNVDFQFKLSVLEIYKEVMYDLLTQTGDLKIQENPETGVKIDGLSEVYLSSLNEFFDYVELSQINRKTAETKLNHNSSRSHCLLILEISQSFKKEKLIKKGILNLVDLAGSEKISKTGAVGLTLEEAKKINLSLSTLGNVIHALTHKAEHIPYRDSKLTRLLKESLGGNYKTSLIVTCSPHSYNLDEVVSSLLFAKRVKTIKNVVKVNIKYSYEELQKMVYLLNAKLKKALNGEIDENANDNEDVSCSNCNLLRKEKRLLENKVQTLLETIRKKDMEISKLKEMLGISEKDEIVIKEKGKKKKHKKKDGKSKDKNEKDQKGEKTKTKDGKKVKKAKNVKNNKNGGDEDSDSSDYDSSEERDQDNSLFEENERAQKVNDLYNKVKDKLSKIQEENARINIIQNEEEELRKIQLKIDDFNKAIQNYIKDNNKNKCFLTMDEMTRNSILMVKNVEYKKGFDEYKMNLSKIYEENMKNLKNQKDLSDSFNIYFLYEYLRFYFNSQIIMQGYRKIILDNRSLEKMNAYLFDIVNDILSVNFDIANNNVINANALNLLKSSLVGDSFVQNPGGIGVPLDQRGIARKIAFNLNSDINQKMIKIITKKNMNIKNSFLSPNSNKASVVDPKNQAANKYTASIINNNTPEANIALINKIKSQETEKSQSKLQMIRNVLIHEIKETDVIKKNMEELKEYINNIINLNINFFNQKIFKGKEELSLVTKKTIVKDSVENLQNHLEDDNTEIIAIETNIAIKNNKVENIKEDKNENTGNKKKSTDKKNSQKKNN